MPTFLIRKIIAPTLALLIAAISALPFTAFAQSDSATNNFQSIVTVKTYVEDSSGSLSYNAQGSGVVISSDGLVLTNRHVVYVEEDLDDSQRPAAYQICIPKSLNADPICAYTADLIAVDKDLDIALLKIHPIDTIVERQPYKYVGWNLNNLPKTNDEVVTMGYPNIGGKTLTVSHGSVAGVISESNKTWLKIDAVSSFGSSGGAAMNNQGELIGITSAANSDYAGSLGYVINMPSLTPWIDSHKNSTPIKSPLTERMASLSKLQIALKVASSYIHSAPRFTFTKPQAWRFIKRSENTISAYNAIDEDGGSINLYIHKFTGLMTIERVMEQLKNTYAIEGKLPVTEIAQKTSVPLKGAKAYRIKTTSKGDTINEVIIPTGEYIVAVSYDYGKDQKDQKVIDTMITSMVFDKPLPIKPQPTSFNSSTAPKFNFKVTKNWLAEERKSQHYPVVLWHKKYANSKIEFTVKKTDENTRGITNQTFIDEQKLQLKQIEKDLDSTGLKGNITATDNHFKLNTNLKNVIMIESHLGKKGETTPFLYERDYVILTPDRIITVGLYVSSPDKAIQAAALKDFNDLLKTLKVEGKK